jgi:hypothetical protein
MEVELVLKVFVFFAVSVTLAFSYAVLNALLGRNKLFRFRTVALGVLCGACIFAVLKLPVVADKLMNNLSPQRDPFPPPSAAAVALHDKMFIADMHADTLMWPHRDLLARHNYGHVDIPRLRDGIVVLQSFKIVCGCAHDSATT